MTEGPGRCWIRIYVIDGRVCCRDCRRRRNTVFLGRWTGTGKNHGQGPGGRLAAWGGGPRNCAQQRAPQRERQLHIDLAAKGFQLPTDSLAPGSSSIHPLTPDSPFTTFTSDEHFDPHDGDDFEFGAFDLSRVLGAVQAMKEEISGMTDEGERRKAAARVALGLVYG